MFILVPRTFVAQAAQPSNPISPQPHDWRWHGLGVGDIAQALALPLALVVAYFTVRLTSREQRRGALLTELVRRFDDLQERSEEIANNLCAHLQGRPNDDLDQQDSHRQIMSSFKALRRRIEVAESLLPAAERKQLADAFQLWWSKATDNGYPVLDAAQAFKPTDAPVLAAQQDHETWDKAIATLKTGCLRHKVKFWRTRNMFGLAYK